MRAHDGSVSNMISISNSSGSPHVSDEDPLEKEMNLTEYEMRIQAANKLATSHVESQHDLLNSMRISYAMATEGGSEVRSIKGRRKTEIVSGD
jgi:hypothetical protein